MKFYKTVIADNLNNLNLFFVPGILINYEIEANTSGKNSK